MGGRRLLRQDGTAARTKHNMANKQGKKYVAAAKLIEARLYSLAEAVPLVKKSNSPNLTRPSRCICVSG